MVPSRLRSSRRHLSVTVVGPPTGSSEKGKATTLFYFEKKKRLIILEMF
jgi:hypothetical protein